MSQYARISESTFASHLHDLHKKIGNKINQSNASCKVWADLHRKFKGLKLETMVWHGFIMINFL